MSAFDKIRRRPVATFIICLTATTPLTGAPAEDAVVLPEISVSGQQETATGPVSGFRADRSASAIKTTTDLIETPQNVTVISRDDPRGFTGSIRGFSPDIYLDGLRLPLATLSQSFDLEPYGLERLEVLRGASSPLYGSGQLGGLLNGVSKQPQPGQLNEVTSRAERSIVCREPPMSAASWCRTARCSGG